MVLGNFLNPKKRIILKAGDRYNVTIIHRRTERNIEVQVVDQVEADLVECAIIGGETTKSLYIGKRQLVSRERFSEQNKIG